jgi:ABC-type nitrate/sulfonate/bicarbonate transport system ATPase subunit
MRHAIEISALSKRFGPRTVFEGLDLTVEPGETLAILGASGCGKSTLLRCLAGLLQPDAGTIAVREDLGLVFQEPRLLPWLTVEKNVAFAARGEVERARVKDALELVGLTPAAHLLPKQLSGGMAQRAALARTLVRNPKILLLDEPLSALDALLRLELQNSLASIIRETGSTAILVTHDVGEALYLADRIVVLDGTPARSVLELDVPIAQRRSRTADLTDERIALLSALGIEGRAPKRSRRGLRAVAP